MAPKRSAPRCTSHLHRRIAALSVEAGAQIEARYGDAVTDADVLGWLGSSESSATRVRDMIDAALASAALYLSANAELMASTLVDMMGEGTTANESVRLAAATRGLELLQRLRKIEHERASAHAAPTRASWRLPEFPVRRDERPGHADPRVAVVPSDTDPDAH